MTSKNCPNCGHQVETDATASAEASNSQRQVMLSIPEHHWPVFKMLFSQMNVKFGMMGLGEFANLLPGYGEQIPLAFEKFRYFDDASIAYAFLAMERGYKIKTWIEEGGAPDYNGNARMNVYAELLPRDDGKVLTLKLSDCAPEENAKEVCAFLEEAAERISPM